MVLLISTDNVSLLRRNGEKNTIIIIKYSLASVAELDTPSDWRPGGRGFNPRRGRQYSFVEIDNELFSTVILSLPLIQEGQLLVSGERLCKILVNHLEDKTCTVNVCLSKLTAFDITTWAEKPQHKQKLSNIHFMTSPKRLSKVSVIVG